MPNYTLTYFDIRGFGEPIRQLFHVANVSYKDVRIPFEDQMPGKQTAEWLEIKKNSPFGRLPVLNVDGLDIPQSAAILRYLAKKFGFAGKTPEEEAWVDAIVDQFKDYVEAFRPLLFATKRQLPAEEVLKIRNEVFNPVKDNYFRILNQVLEKSKSGFLVGDGLTWADLVVADNLFTMRDWQVFEEGNKKHEKLKDFQKRIYGHPKLEGWIRDRPQTPL